MPLVTFKQDVFPYVRGDVVQLEGAEKDRVDAVIKGRKLEGAYVAGNKHQAVVDPVDDPRDIPARRLNADRDGAQQNAIDQAAQLEAQRTAVPEPANVEALGVGQEAPQTVTGTEPAEGVTVTNPNEATDIGSGKGAEVKVSKSKK